MNDERFLAKWLRERTSEPGDAHMSADQIMAHHLAGAHLMSARVGGTFLVLWEGLRPRALHSGPILFARSTAGNC